MSDYARYTHASTHSKTHIFLLTENKALGE